MTYLELQTLFIQALMKANNNKNLNWDTGKRTLVSLSCVTNDSRHTRGKEENDGVRKLQAAKYRQIRDVKPYSQRTRGL